MPDTNYTIRKFERKDRAIGYIIGSKNVSQMERISNSNEEGLN